MKKRIAVILTLIISVVILVLTFQNPEQTTALSNWAMNLLKNLGIIVGSKPLRHYIHYIMYFILGLALSQWMKEWKAIIVGCCIGLIDELIKILLPTREFDWTDLLRDFAGIVVAVLLVMMVRKLRRG